MFWWMLRQPDARGDHIFILAIHIAVVQMFHLNEREFSFTAAADREVVLDTMELLCHIGSWRTQ